MNYEFFESQHSKWGPTQKSAKIIHSIHTTAKKVKKIRSFMKKIRTVGRSALGEETWRKIRGQLQHSHTATRRGRQHGRTELDGDKRPIYYWE